MRTTARTVYPGFPRRSAAQAARAKSITRFKLGAPPAPNSRERCSRVTRRASATWPVCVGTPARRSTSSHASSCNRSVSRSNRGASASAARARRDPLSRDRVIDALDQHAGEPRTLARRDQRPVVGPQRGERVHGDAREAGRQTDHVRRTAAHVEHDGVHEPLLQQALDVLQRATEPHAPGRARVSLLHGATCLAARVEHRHDRRQGSSTCTNARSISAARRSTSRALS